MSNLRMPDRQPTDGPVSATRENGNIRIAVETAGERRSILMGEHNAWRIFGLLAVMLGLPMTKEVGKAIKF